MPTYKGKDGQDRYSMNPQVGKSRYGGAEKPGAALKEERGEEEGRATDTSGHDSSVEGETHITHHGDGTHTTRHSDGSTEEHPHHLHLLAALGHRISGGDSHHIIHHDGVGLHSHHIGKGGEHEGPHDHANVDELKSNMDQFLTEEGREGSKAGEMPLGRRSRKPGGDETEPDFSSSEDSSGISSLM